MNHFPFTSFHPQLWLKYLNWMLCIQNRKPQSLIFDLNSNWIPLRTCSVYLAYIVSSPPFGTALTMHRASVSCSSHRIVYCFDSFAKLFSISECVRPIELVANFAKKWQCKYNSKPKTNGDICIGFFDNLRYEFLFAKTHGKSIRAKFIFHPVVAMKLRSLWCLSQ